jgi:hypothetical protein
MASTVDQILCASRAWLNAARRGWIRRHPGEECTLPTWEDLRPIDRVDLMTTIQAALIAAEPANVKRSMERLDDNASN